MRQVHRKQLRRIEHEFGFTLTELAIVLVIVALLMGGLLLPLSAQVDQKNYSDTRQQLNEIREALLGYAMTHTAANGKPYLPCPDTDNDGKENRTSGTRCSAGASAEGNLPWSALGLTSTDAWNNRFRYRVHNNFADSNVGFTLSSNGILRVCDVSGCASLLADALPAVVVSHGKNGFGAINASGNANAPADGADEFANSNGDNDFVMHNQTNSPNVFDDLVVWLPPGVLMNRMISAGKLP
jgi:prepilin-type N-terminal cleavage/methylation domain-containing protein